MGELYLPVFFNEVLNDVWKGLSIFLDSGDYIFFGEAVFGVLIGDLSGALIVFPNFQK